MVAIVSDSLIPQEAEYLKNVLYRYMYSRENLGKEAVENVIKELRAEIEKIHAQHKENTMADVIKLKTAEDQIAQLKADSEKASNSVVEIQAKLLVAEEKLRNVEKSREQESEASENECEKLRAELDQVKKQCEEEVAKQKEESETAVQEFKTRAEKKLAKIKAAAEKDVTSAKAELLLEMDELRRNLSDRDRRIDELVVEKARMEQQIIGQQEMEKELEQRRVKEKEATDKLRGVKQQQSTTERKRSCDDRIKRTEPVKATPDTSKLDEGREAQSHLESSEDKCKELENRLDDLVTELDQTTASLNEERARAGSDLAELEQLRSGTETQIQNMAAQLKASEEKLLEKEQELEAAKSAQAESAAVVSSLESELATLKQQLEESTRKAAEDSEGSSASLQKLQQSLIAEEKRVLELLEQLKTEQTEAKRREQKAKDDAKKDR
ncbi:M protein repeat protein, partial [Ancylostoma duodenale]